MGLVLSLLGAATVVTGIVLAFAGMAVLWRSPPGWAFTRDRCIGLGGYLSGWALVAGGLVISPGGGL